jgi:hypothetical protein
MKHSSRRIAVLSAEIVANKRGVCNISSMARQKWLSVSRNAHQKTLAKHQSVIAAGASAFRSRLGIGAAWLIGSRHIESDINRSRRRRSAALGGVVASSCVSSSAAGSALSAS